MAAMANHSIAVHVHIQSLAQAIQNFYSFYKNLMTSRRLRNCQPHHIGSKQPQTVQRANPCAALPPFGSHQARCEVVRRPGLPLARGSPPLPRTELGDKTRRGMSLYCLAMPIGAPAGVCEYVVCARAQTHLHLPMFQMQACAQEFTTYR